MKPKFFPAALGALSAAAATDIVYRVHHRLHHSALPQLPYAEYGSIHLADNNALSFYPNFALAQDLATFSDSVAGLNVPSDGLYHQLALQRGDEDQPFWDFTSVKACHLPHAASQTFVLHTQDTIPFAMDYFVSPIPPDGSCPNTANSNLASLSPFAAFAQNLRGLNTTVLLKSPHVPPLPELRKPQPITLTGEPLQPVPEKSFIQKYWMYIAVAFVALLLTGGEEEGPRRQARA